jgi:hypothetical protein
MYVDQRLRRLLVRYRGKVQFDYSGPKDVCSIRARRDGSADDDWLYVAFEDKEDNYELAVSNLRWLLTMPQAEFDKKCQKDSD